MPTPEALTASSAAPAAVPSFAIPEVMTPASVAPTTANAIGMVQNSITSAGISTLNVLAPVATVAITAAFMYQGIKSIFTGKNEFLKGVP